MRYENRIQRLKVDIQELEYKIAKAINEQKPAFAKRLEILLNKEKKKLERWLSI